MSDFSLFLGYCAHSGDVVIVIWDDAFTENFVNADDKHLLPTEKYNNFFSGE
jgi:hypothetical protein